MADTDDDEDAPKKAKPPRPREESEIVALLTEYLRDIGWINSFERRRPIDAKGEPCPWYTYAAINFITPRVQPHFTVFEYGSGSSTLWWAKRTAKVITCEHEPRWFERLKETCPPNVTPVHHALEYGGAYCREILNHGKIFDVVAIDGRDRVNCAKNAVERLADSGVIVWDNSERRRYQEGYDYLAANGFRRIDFLSLGPINRRAWMTSVFYRSNNCFGI